MKGSFPSIRMKMIMKVCYSLTLMHLMLRLAFLSVLLNKRLEKVPNYFFTTLRMVTPCGTVMRSI